MLQKQSSSTSLERLFGFFIFPRLDLHPSQVFVLILEYLTKIKPLLSRYVENDCSVSTPFFSSIPSRCVPRLFFQSAATIHCILRILSYSIVAGFNWARVYSPFIIQETPLLPGVRKIEDDFFHIWALKRGQSSTHESIVCLVSESRTDACPTSQPKWMHPQAPPQLAFLQSRSAKVMSRNQTQNQTKGEVQQKQRERSRRREQRTWKRNGIKTRENQFNLYRQRFPGVAMLHVLIRTLELHTLNRVRRRLVVTLKIVAVCVASDWWVATTQILVEGECVGAIFIDTMDKSIVGEMFSICRGGTWLTSQRPRIFACSRPVRCRPWWSEEYTWDCWWRSLP